MIPRMVPELMFRLNASLSIAVKVKCPLHFVFSYVQPVTQHVQPVTQHVQPVTQHVQPVTQHVQPVTQHVQPVTQCYK